MARPSRPARTRPTRSSSRSRSPRSRTSAPGTAWSYSNTGYILLGLVAEQIVGRPIEQELQARFFEPLGMIDTQPRGDGAPVALWTGYIHDGSDLREVPMGRGYTADGGAWITSLDDLITWAHAFFGGQLHRAETLALAQMPAGGALLETVARNFGLESGGYGLGLVVGTDATFGPLLAGAGNGDGARTFVGYAPEQELAFAVAVNIGDGSVPIVETLSAAGPLLEAVRERAAHAP
ncbi:MAG: beta-lactamase family protein [Sandaracinaceae bacterium]|nr:beta-lactamase family protein [Sandaracinaceae bacterium]